MTTYDVIVGLCKDHKLAITALERELGFGRGSIGKLKTGNTTLERLQKIADYFGVTVEYLTTGEKKDGEKYYLNDETAAMAQQLFENKELRVLFDAARDAEPEDLKTTYDVLMALKRKERGDDDTGC